MISSSGKHKWGRDKAKAVNGENRSGLTTHTHTHTSIMYSWLYTVYELACAYSTQSFDFLGPFSDSCLICDYEAGFNSSSSCLQKNNQIKTYVTKK